MAGFDVLGREVAVLVDGVSDDAADVARLAAGALAPGTYVVRLTVAGAAPYVRTLTVLR